MNDGEKYLSEQDIIEWQREKRAEWMRDKKLIEEGKLKPEDLMAPFHVSPSDGRLIDLTGVKAALDWEDEFDGSDD